MKKRFKTQDVVYIGLCSALIAICSWISIPATVPFTMQTFAVALTGMLLGGKKGVAAVVVYICGRTSGLFGIPFRNRRIARHNRGIYSRMDFLCAAFRNSRNVLQ